MGGQIVRQGPQVVRAAFLAVHEDDPGPVGRQGMEAGYQQQKGKQLLDATGY
jgi:hypothetical protein